jgi:hypothetical protein
VPASVYDVAILSDFRHPGGSAGIAPEVHAQAEAALSTVLVHAPAPGPSREAPFHPRISDLLRDGAAVLAHDGDEISARLLLIRRPGIFTGEPAALPRVRAERTVVVLDEPPGAAYDLTIVRERVHGRFGAGVQWAPASGRVRRALPDCLLTADDWHEIVDVAHWWREREGDGGAEPAQWPAGWDAPEYRAAASRGREFVERRYGHQSHLARLAAYGIRPRISPPSPGTGPALVVTRSATRRVLMVGDDGPGLGHLTRLMAIGRRLPPGHEAVVASQSYAAPVAHRVGFLTEYIPSRKALDTAHPRWTALLRARLAHLVDLHEPAVVAVDCLPYAGIVQAVREHPGITWVWVRRAMWQRGAGADWIIEGKVFDHVLEPGEFAAAADLGPTVSDRANAHQVEPITFLDPAELLDRDAARAALGLDDRPAALVRLGAGVLDDVASPVTRICRHLAAHDVQVVVADSPVATRPVPPVAGARVVTLFPVSRHLRAFDLAVTAAGYNSYHEQIGAGIPTVLLPDAATRLDDQVCRARFAAATGVALAVEDAGSDELEQALDRLLRPEVRAGLARRCAELPFGNGGVAAAAWLSGLPARRVGG